MKTIPTKKNNNIGTINKKYLSPIRVTFSAYNLSRAICMDYMFEVQLPL